MNYDIIFYLSGKTSQLQYRIQKSLESPSLTFKSACAALEQKELEEKLSQAIKENSLVFIVGEQNSSEQSAEQVLEKVINSRNDNISSEKIKTDGGFCEIKTVGEQSIIFLPDDTEKTEKIMPELKEKLAKKYKLKFPVQDKVKIDDITKELDRTMGGINRVKLDRTGINAERKLRSQLKKLKITIAVLLVLAALQMGAASYLFISQM